MQQLHELLEARRAEIGITKVKLSQKVGVTPTTIHRILSGNSFPSKDTYYRLHECLNVEPATKERWSSNG